MISEKGGIVQEGVADHVLQGTFMQGVLTAGQVTELVILMEGKGPGGYPHPAGELPLLCPDCG